MVQQYCALLGAVSVPTPNPLHLFTPPTSPLASTSVFPVVKSWVCLFPLFTCLLLPTCGPNHRVFVSDLFHLLYPLRPSMLWISQSGFSGVLLDLGCYWQQYHRSDVVFLVHYTKEAHGYLFHSEAFCVETVLVSSVQPAYLQGKSFKLGYVGSSKVRLQRWIL